MFRLHVYILCIYRQTFWTTCMYYVIVFRTCLRLCVVMVTAVVIDCICMQGLCKNKAWVRYQRCIIGKAAVLYLPCVCVGVNMDSQPRKTNKTENNCVLFGIIHVFSLAFGCCTDAVMNPSDALAACLQDQKLYFSIAK